MRDVIVILYPGDIPAAQQLCAQWTDYEVHLFDPQLGDPALAAELRNVELLQAAGGRPYHVNASDAHSSAYAVEAEIDRTLSKFGMDLRIAGWQHLNLYYLLMTLDWYTDLWPRVEERYRGRTTHIFRSTNPAQYFFPSFLPAELLIERLQLQGSPCVAHDSLSRAVPDYSIPDLQGNAPAADGRLILTHLPTCFYDVDYFRDELQAANTALINLKARFWDISIPARHQIGLTTPDCIFARLEAPEEAQLAALTRALRPVLEDLLAPRISAPVWRSRQIEHITQSYRAQWATYRELQRYFREIEPVKLVLSEHDSGFLGPLVSFAESRSLPIMMLPHSKVCADIEFNYSNIVVLTHPIQGRSVCDSAGRAVAQSHLCYPERFVGSSMASAGLRTLSLMLNSLSLSGVPFAPTDVYLAGLRRVVDWCRSNGVAVKIRCKPGYSIHNLLSVLLGIDRRQLEQFTRETLDEHMRHCDLCLMYDLASTASLYFLRNSIPILNPLVTCQSAAQLAVVHPDVIPPESVDSTLQRLDDFKSDPRRLDAFRSAQFQAYLARFQGALPLRDHI